MKKLGDSFSGALRTFGFWISNGTLGLPVLEGVAYKEVLLEEPSAMEQILAIFANVIELDDHGRVMNAKHAEHRAAQWLRSYVDPSYTIDPPLEDWETMLHDPPPREDPKLVR